MLTYFAVYYLLFSWYTAIVEGARFLLSLYLPLLFSLMISLKHLAQQHEAAVTKPSRLRPIKALGILTGIVTVLILLEIAVFVPRQLASGFFGA